MINQHPITPPPELIQQWWDRGLKKGHWSYIAKEAARWGADQELDACCHEVQSMYSGGSRLRDRRRPKPPSLKELALAELEEILKNPQSPLRSDTENVRRALEALPND